MGASRKNDSRSVCRLKWRSKAIRLAWVSSLAPLVFASAEVVEPQGVVELGPSPLPEWLHHCDPRNYVRRVLTQDLHNAAIAPQDEICLHREARAWFHLCSERMQHVRAAAFAEARVSNDLHRFFQEVRNPEDVKKVLQHMHDEEEIQNWEYGRSSAVAVSQQEHHNRRKHSGTLSKALGGPKMSRFFVERNCSQYGFHRDLAAQFASQGAFVLEASLFRLHDGEGREIRRHLPYMATLWRDTSLEVNAKLMLLHDIQWDVMNFFLRTKLDQHTKEEVNLPFRGHDRHLLVKNLFRLPPDWSLHPRTRRWHVVCALCRKVVTENPDLEVLRVAEIGVFAGETTLHMLQNCTNAYGEIEPFDNGVVVSDDLKIDREEDANKGRASQELAGAVAATSVSSSSPEDDEDEFFESRSGRVNDTLSLPNDLEGFLAAQEEALTADNSMPARRRRNLQSAGGKDPRRQPLKPGRGVPVQYNLIDPWIIEGAGFQIMLDWYNEHESWKINSGNSGDAVYANVLRRIRRVEAGKPGFAGQGSLFPIREMAEGETVPPTESGIYTHKRTSEAASRSVQEVDFLFVDGDHSYQGCHDDMRYFYPKTKILAAGHDFRYWDFHGIVLAVLNMRRPGTQAYKDYGKRLEGPVYLDSENIHWSYIRRE
ncbi:unnamed protein product [Amoebophrya sp. A25]|nr:unnamed protein product [Amoebophrya sp. A25]|eukprot:GSA25T00020161001.1